MLDKSVNKLPARIRFFTAAEGGRTTDLEGARYGAPLFVGGEGFDFRFNLPDARVLLGKWVEVELMFLYPDLALPKLPADTRFTVWEGKTVAEGIVLQQ
ncbi:MAG: hypothetical protein ABIZ64_14820 [Casimicrobium sp.]|jgi:hypothetical protein